ncbi:unnamed protein product [Cuscuta europaea]|uniref:GAG-pre-integrase domain-containing protein n=1 Tax=Cuscuta europaea TaxID=41803 RepID=A0A9P1EC75_CUSEU|nr:unnamed protein product [Cuscuta europaea]
MTVTLDSDLWHRRLRHASNGKLQHISFLKGLQQKNIFCDPCLRAKQTRLPFPNSTNMSNEEESFPNDDEDVQDDYGQTPPTSTHDDDDDDQGNEGRRDDLVLNDF